MDDGTDIQQPCALLGTKQRMKYSSDFRAHCGQVFEGRLVINFPAYRVARIA